MSNESNEMMHVPSNGAALAPIIETAAAGVAAQEEAKIRARYQLAMLRPRDVDMVREKILKACKRPGFAATARYSLPRGGKSIVGPSIRFAEEVARCLGNISIDASVVHDDAERRIVRVTVTDVEANLPYSADVVIEKFVERNQLRQGQEALSSRMNSAGRVVYRIAADEGELVVKQAALTSKSLRNLILRVLPGDVLEDAMAACVATMAKQDAQDPDAARKGVLERFATLGISASDLKAYVGHDMARVDTKLWQELRDLFTALKEGATTWAEVMEGKTSGAKKAEAGAAPQTLDEKAAAKRKAKADAEPKTDAPPVENVVEREPGSDG